MHGWQRGNATVRTPPHGNSLRGVEVGGGHEKANHTAEEVTIPQGSKRVAFLFKRAIPTSESELEPLHPPDWSVTSGWP